MPKMALLRTILSRLTTLESGRDKKQTPAEHEMMIATDDMSSSRGDPVPSWSVENFLVLDVQCRQEEDECEQSLFVNRGEELFHCTREAWLEQTHPDALRAKPLSQKATLALVAFIKDKEGPHPLPRRIPLSCMVQIYNKHIWNDHKSAMKVCETNLQHV